MDADYEGECWTAGPSRCVGTSVYDEESIMIYGEPVCVAAKTGVQIVLVLWQVYALHDVGSVCLKI
jgi:hypothetical protein